MATRDPHPLEQLEAEDREFVLRFVLASGSLKDVAEAYGVSYPTLLGRLDRLIGRLRQAAEQREHDPMAELLATLVERGQLNANAARQLLKLHREQTDGDA